MKIKAVLTQNEVSQILVAAREEAHTNGLAVAIAIVDDGGTCWRPNAWTTPRRSAATSPSKKPEPRHWANANPRATKRWSMAAARRFSAPRC